MKTFATFLILLPSLLLTGCANNPAPKPEPLSREEVLKKVQDAQQPKGQPPVPVNTHEKESIIPGTDEAGQRGEIARKMRAKSAALFLKADTNRDSLLSVEEAEKHLPFVSRDFPRFDKNQDNSISWEELLGHDKWPAPVHSGAKP